MFEYLRIFKTGFNYDYNVVFGSEMYTLGERLYAKLSLLGWR